MSELNTHFRRHALLLSQRDRVCSQLVKLEAGCRVSSAAFREVALRQLFRKAELDRALAKLEETCCFLPETPRPLLLPRVRGLEHYVPAVAREREANVLRRNEVRTVQEHFEELAAKARKPPPPDLTVRELAESLEEVLSSFSEELRVQRETLHRHTHLLENDDSGRDLRRRLDRQSAMLSTLLRSRKDAKTAPKSSGAVKRRRDATAEWEMFDETYDRFSELDEGASTSTTTNVHFPLE